MIVIKVQVVLPSPAVGEWWQKVTKRPHNRSTSSNTSRATSLFTSPLSLKAPLGPQLKTPLMSSKWQRLHHFHTSLSAESGIKMLEAEWTIDFPLLLFFGLFHYFTRPSSHCSRNLGAILGLYNVSSKFLISFLTRAACEMLRMWRPESLVTAISAKTY